MQVCELVQVLDSLMRQCVPPAGLFGALENASFVHQRAEHGRLGSEPEVTPTGQQTGEPLHAHSNCEACAARSPRFGANIWFEFRVSKAAHALCYVEAHVTTRLKVAFNFVRSSMPLVHCGIIAWMSMGRCFSS